MNSTTMEQILAGSKVENCLLTFRLPSYRTYKNS